MTNLVGEGEPYSRWALVWIVFYANLVRGHWNQLGFAYIVVWQDFDLKKPSQLQRVKWWATPSRVERFGYQVASHLSNSRYRIIRSVLFQKSNNRRMIPSLFLHRHLLPPLPPNMWAWQSD